MYAIKGTTIQLTDSVRAVLPCVALAFFAVGAAWVLKHHIAADWHPITRLLTTSGTIALIMACGWMFLYGRSGFTKLLNSP
jgi:uncharacterized membrane protein